MKLRTNCLFGKWKTANSSGIWLTHHSRMSSNRQKKRGFQYKPKGYTGIKKYYKVKKRLVKERRRGNHLHEIFQL
jgi:hypothetical protein